MKQYHQNLQAIQNDGEQRETRSGETMSLFGLQTRYNLQNGFPAVTTKKLAWESVKSELLWFIEGGRDERRLCELRHGTRDPAKKTIWTANANADYWKGAHYDGDLGRVYGVQWRHWRFPIINGQLVQGSGEVDQLEKLIDGIKDDPTGRRHILTAWNPGELDQMALPPCHLLAQFHVSKELKLSCQMYQRSADMFLGVPFNIASYALLTHMIAQVCGLDVGEFIHTIGDAHIYSDHMSAVNTLLGRTHYPLPSLWLNPDIKNIDDFTMNDIALENYQCHPAIIAPMAV